MKLRLLNLNTRAQLRRNKGLRSSLPYVQSLNVGLLFTVEDKQKHDVIKDFVRRLEQDGKKVSVLCFRPDNKENYDFKFDFFTEKEVSFWGSVQSEIAMKFIEKPFDFLFCTDNTPHPMVMNLVARSKARCRVGKYWEGRERFFEMMVGEKNGIRSLVDQMYKYVTGLR